MLRLTLAFALCILPTLGFAEDDDHLSEVDGLRILHAWTRAHQIGTADVYLEVENQSNRDAKLTGGDVHEGDGEVVILAQPTQANSSPVPLPDFIFPMGSDFIFDEDGVFLRVSGVEDELEEGDELEIHLAFDGFGELVVHVEVESEDAKNHSHAGHNH
ncbi:MAG: hypothetical protein AAGD04_11910 [Pseudomonadota bacterium]